MATLALKHRRYLVLGTDTDVGKTFVCAALCAALLDSGARIVVCKPVETGAPDESDLDAVARLCARDGRLILRSGLRFALAAAPTAAARAQGQPAPSARDVAAIVREAQAGADGVVVETCGGALTPLSDADYVADLVAHLPDYRPLLVAGLRLGVLSSIFGAVEYLKQCGAEPPAIVLNDRFAASPRWYVDATRADLRARGLEVAAFIAHGAEVATVDFAEPAAVG